jgi:hypothetical protein
MHDADSAVRLELEVCGLLRGADARAFRRTLIAHESVLSCIVAARLDRCSLLLHPRWYVQERERESVCVCVCGVGYAMYLRA